MIELPALASCPRRQYFTAHTKDGQHLATVLASTSAQVRRYFKKVWNVSESAITVSSRPDLNKTL